MRSSLTQVLLSVAVLFFPSIALADLQSAKNTYARGDLPGAIKELEALLDPTSTPLSQDDELEAHRILGAIYFQQKKTDPTKEAKAKEQFEAVLRINFDATLDPLKFSSEMCGFFDDLKTAITKDRILLQRKTLIKRAGDAFTKGADLLVAQESKTPKYYALLVEQHLPALSFIPVVGQVQNGDTSKGLLLLGGEVAAISTSISTFVFLQKFTDQADDDPALDCLLGDPNPKGGLSALEYCRLARDANIISTTAAIGMAAFAIYDSRAHFKAETVRIQEVPPDIGKRLRQQTSQLQLSPSIGPTNVGLGVVGRF